MYWCYTNPDFVDIVKCERSGDLPWGFFQLLQEGYLYKHYKQCNFNWFMVQCIIGQPKGKNVTSK